MSNAPSATARSRYFRVCNARMLRKVALNGL
jgi:hypothetical protein